MNRRKFFGTLIGGVATGAAVRTWPFRVFSFPSEPVADPSFSGYAGRLFWFGANNPRAGVKLTHITDPGATRMDFMDLKYWGRDDIARISYYETPPYPQLHFVGLERSNYPGRLKSA